MPKYMVITKGDGEVWAAFFDSITEAEGYKMDGECGMGFLRKSMNATKSSGNISFCTHDGGVPVICPGRKRGAYYEDACGIFGMGVYYMRKWGDNMARDMAKKNIADYRWAKENCMRLNMKIRNDSGIPEALERMKETGQSANSYAIAALVTQLRKDGYLPESPKTK